MAFGKKTAPSAFRPVPLLSLVPQVRKAYPILQCGFILPAFRPASFFPILFAPLFWESEEAPASIV